MSDPSSQLLLVSSKFCKPAWICDCFFLVIP